MESITSFTMFESVMKKYPAVLFYVSHSKCQVCKVLKPWVEMMIQEDFPHSGLYYIDTRKSPELAAMLSVFTVPVVVFFMEGKEYVRRVRNFSINELRDAIHRPYNLYFGNTD